MKARKGKAKANEYSKDQAKKSKLSSRDYYRLDKDKEKFQGHVEFKRMVLKVESILQRMKDRSVSIRTKNASTSTNAGLYGI